MLEIVGVHLTLFGALFDEFKHAPPGIVNASEEGRFVPITVNSVATPIAASAGAMDVTFGDAVGAVG